MFRDLNPATKICLIALATGYIFSMFVYPLIDRSMSIAELQRVWDRWQPLNVGMLALAASILALTAASHATRNQRERDFVAALAFLPASLSDLCQYFKESGQVLSAFWDGKPLAAPINAPDLPDDYKTVFRDAIRNADPDIGEFLAYTLRCLQVHDSRLKELIDSSRGGRKVATKNDPNLVSYMYSLGELQALVNTLFPFARRETLLLKQNLTWADFKSAYYNIGIRPERILNAANDSLMDFTQRRISRDQRKRLSERQPGNA